MDKEALKKVLLSEGLLEELDELFDDDVTLKDWVSRHEDLVRSNRAIAQAVQADAPHEVKEGYFKDKDEKRQYEAGEKKYNEELAKKQQLADEYQRAKDIEDFSEFRADKGILGNLAALGMKLTPKAAKDVYIKEGYNPTKLAVHGGLGTMANVAELAPGVGTAGKAITTFAGPTIRAGQEIAEGKELGDVGTHFATDAGLNTVFSYLPLKEAYGYVKRILGQGGRGEKAAKNAVEDVLEQADALADKKETLTSLGKDMTKVLDYAEQLRYGNMSDLEKLKFADDIANDYPNLAKAIRDEVQAYSTNRMHAEAAQQLADALPDAGTIPEAIRDFGKKTISYAEQAEKESAKKLTTASEKVADELEHAEAAIANKQSAVNNKLFDEQGVLTKPSVDVSEAAKYANPSTAAKIIAKTKPVIQSTGRIYTGSSNEPTVPTDKEYSSAIEYIIQSNKRQWNAGFKPRDGIELEAWQIAKDRGEI